MDVVAQTGHAFFSGELPAHPVLLNVFLYFFVHVSVVFRSQVVGANFVIKQRLESELSVVSRFSDQRQSVSRHSRDQTFSEEEIDFEFVLLKILLTYL